MIEILETDITTLRVDAIVNAANEALLEGGGVCGAIYRAAGPQLKTATQKLRNCATGGAVLTPGYDLPARFVIHAVGPIWRGGSAGEAELLRSAYESAFRVAKSEPSIRSIAFPAISTGIYGFPKQEAASIAIEVMRGNERDFERIIACLFDAESAALYWNAASQRSMSRERPGQ
jgi:O-acetyl-ADP-ribose deacetylase